MVHGQVGLQRNDAGQIGIRSGKYDFEIHDPNKYRFPILGTLRNTATEIGRAHALGSGGFGNSYRINYRGSPTVYPW